VYAGKIPSDQSLIPWYEAFRRFIRDVSNVSYNFAFSRRHQPIVHDIAVGYAYADIRHEVLRGDQEFGTTCEMREIMTGYDVDES
jgi:hypothetical protein